MFTQLRNHGLKLGYQIYWIKWKWRLSEGSGDSSEFISGFPQLGCTIGDNELDSRLRNDNNNQGFQINTDEDIFQHCLSESAQSEEIEEGELK